jgi:hypothetical protein
MKKAAIILGAIALIIFLLGGLFKIMHWPGAGILLIYGTLFNAIIAIPVIAIYTLKTDSPYKSWNFFGAISAFILIAGWFFKMNHWPAQGILLTTGTVLLIVFVLFYASKLLKE